MVKLPNITVKGITQKKFFGFIRKMFGRTYRRFFFYKVIGKYPKTSLVELNDGRAGFVMSVPDLDLDRPQIVVLRSKEGELLTHHDFVDLEIEQDLQISQVLDAQDIFGDDALDVFSNINAV